VEERQVKGQVKGQVKEQVQGQVKGQVKEQVQGQVKGQGTSEGETDLPCLACLARALKRREEKEGIGMKVREFIVGPQGK
jgi:hypothetical protein